MSAVRESLSERLAVISRIGVLMLRSGAASFRVEDVMRRVATVLDVQSIDMFVTPSGMVLTLIESGPPRTVTLKIPPIGVDMVRISALEELSRTLPETITLAELSQRLDGIEHRPPMYSRLTVILMVGLACGAFAVILGGSAGEFVAAFTGAMLAQYLRFRLLASHVSPYLVTTVCAASATLISEIAVHLFNAPTPRAALIASVLLLVPGVPFITALLDLVHLDLISGIARGTYAALLLMFIGLGMLLVLTITGTGIL
ncbi:MAG: threonine/serine exporter family protein [Anaerolineae bacterium]